MTLLVAAARAVLAAFTFLTVVPLGRFVELDGRDVARGAMLFPVVGGAVGALTGAAAWVLGDQLPPLLAAALAVALGAAVTGALHLDGLADCADGFGARGRTPQDRLRVMRDHTNGTYGGTALLLALVIRVAALAALAGTQEALLFATAAGALSRVAGPLMAVLLPYAEPGGGEALNKDPSQLRAAGALVLAGLIAYACLPHGADYALALVAFAVVLLVVTWTARGRLGGVTGDVMGACSELIELAVLTVLVGTL